MTDLTAIFKAYDIRGRVGTELTPEVTEVIGKAFAEWLPETGIVAVGRDMRPDSKDLADGIIRGLRAQGRDVWDIGEVTSDMIYFAVGANALAGGAMVTASHNPGDYNGIKLCREMAKPVGEESGLYEVRDSAQVGQFEAANTEGSLESRNLDEAWVQHVLSFIEPGELKPLHIAVDAGNGMGGKIFPELEPYVPFQVEELFFELDGTFPNHIANPLELKNLVDVQAAIKQSGCDAGVAFDGDGDRAVLLDELGEPLSGSVLTAILAKHFLEIHPGATILHNAICGRVVPETITALGGVPVRTRVGHSFIKGSMLEHAAVFAGEHSGHYYFQDNFNADSGLIAAVLGLYLLSVSGQKLSELAAPYRKAYVQIQETNFEVSDKDAVLTALRDKFTDGNSDQLDGLTVNYPDGWFNVRPSNTEPLLRLNAEATSQEELDALVGRVRAVITA